MPPPSASPPSSPRNPARPRCASPSKAAAAPGFSYKFDLTDARNDDDVAIEKNGATVLIDDLSLVYMGGSVIDFRRRSDGPVLPDQEPERGRFLRLRHQFFDLTGLSPGLFRPRRRR